MVTKSGSSVKFNSRFCGDSDAFYFVDGVFKIFSCGKGAKALAFFQKGGILMAIPRG